MQARQVPRALVEKLLVLKDMDICIHAAFETRMSGLITSDLDLQLGGVGASDTMQSIMEERLIPMCAVIALHMTALGVVPIRFAELTVDVSADAALQQRHGKRAPSRVKEIIPVVPHFSTWELWVEINDDGELVPWFQSTIDDEPIMCVKSVTNAGPTFDGKISSDMAILLEEWKTVQRLRKINESSIKTQACPSVFISRKHQTVFAAENADAAQRTADEAMQMSEVRTYNPRPQGMRLERIRKVEDLMRSVEAGNHFDVSEAVVKIPEDWEITTQPTFTPIDISMYEASYEAKVLAVFKIPPSFYNSGKTGGGSLNDGQDTEQSENDRHRFTTGVSTTQIDIVRALRLAYNVITNTDRVAVLLPAVTFSTLEELRQLYELHVIGPAALREFAARHQNIHSDYVVKAPGLLQIRQTEWVPPEKKKAKTK